jgi:hypothetical protein
MYAALNVRDIDGILLPQNTNMPRDPASENSDVLNGMKLKAFAGQQHDAHIAAHLMMGMSPMLQANPMAAIELQKHVLDHIRLKAEEDVEADLFKMYGTDPDRIVSAIQKEGMVAIKVATYMQEIARKAFRRGRRGSAGRIEAAGDPTACASRSAAYSNRSAKAWS